MSQYVHPEHATDSANQKLKLRCRRCGAKLQKTGNFMMTDRGSVEPYRLDEWRCIRCEAPTSPFDDPEYAPC